jgi:hypothetical protein
MSELSELVERYDVWLDGQPLSERTRPEYSRQVAGSPRGSAPIRFGAGTRSLIRSRAIMR